MDDASMMSVMKGWSNIRMPERANDSGYYNLAAGGGFNELVLMLDHTGVTEALDGFKNTLLIASAC